MRVVFVGLLMWAEVAFLSSHDVVRGFSVEHTSRILDSEPCILFNVLDLPGSSSHMLPQLACLRLRGGVTIGKLATMGGIKEVPEELLRMSLEAAEAGEDSEFWTDDEEAREELKQWMAEDPRCIPRGWKELQQIQKHRYKTDQKQVVLPPAYGEDGSDSSIDASPTGDDGSRVQEDTALQHAMQKARAFEESQDPAAAEQGDAKAQFNMGARLAKQRKLKAAVTWFRRAAQQSHPKAQYNLAVCMLNGQGVEQDTLAARDLLTSAAEQNHGQAAYQLGMMYMNGVKARDKTAGKRDRAPAGSSETSKGRAWAVEARPRKAVRFLSLAAGLGIADAAYQLACCYSDGVCVERNDGAARHWLQTAADQGSSAAMSRLGHLLLSSDDGADREVHAKAFQWFEKAAASGNADAMYGLARMILESEERAGQPRRTDKAAKMLATAAKTGHRDATYLYGRCLLDGRGVPQDTAQGRKLLRRAATRGVGDAWYHLGLSFAQGNAADVNHTRAAKMFRKASKGGDARAMVNLGWMHAQGVGLSRNDERAASYFRKAATRNDTCAMMNLAQMYQRGVGVAPSEELCAKWMLKAAHAGEVAAQMDVAARFDAGRGLLQDAVAATRWYRAAAQAGDGEAQYRSGERVWRGEGARSDRSEALHWFMSAAELGHPLAQLEAGRLLARGVAGVRDPDPPAALHLLELARESGVESATWEIASLCLDGRGVAADPERAVSLLQEAAAREEAEAMRLLGSCYLKGVGVARDAERAASLLLRAAEAGSVDGAFEYGELRLAGDEGVSADDAVGASWVLTSAHRGCLPAMHKAAELFRLGVGVGRDDAMAAKFRAHAREHEQQQDADTVLGLQRAALAPPDSRRQNGDEEEASQPESLSGVPDDSEEEEEEEGGVESMDFGSDGG